MTEQEFVDKYSLTEFSNSRISYKDLRAIQKDYESQQQKYEDAGVNLVRTLLRFPSVHSAKYRIKDSEHLMAKIVRKHNQYPNLEINISNYQSKIQDLIGVRILHLFKEEWESIHTKLVENFKMISKPEANVRKGDLIDIINRYKKCNCKVKYHPDGYRSVHYIVKTEPTRKPLVCEIQVRTIFEEAWSEIDHIVRYPYFNDSEILNQYLRIFNRLAGSADEMGGFVLNLKKEALLRVEKTLELENLRDQVQKSTLNENEKKEIEEGIKKIAVYTTDHGNVPLEEINKLLVTYSRQKPFLPIDFSSPLIAAALMTLKKK